ncbi:DNA-processing protein DprA [Glaciecola sp. KUL10]|uniref:DNA-processing protein DprA n=1 Tax=Glaciecola sp. (strain KUL10) TaxID=2161813 RepID=UPI000D787639|nr:DNA-processing protein DprA [Glaciecola sp. KUL10]GBL06237.1 DNA processing protein [Glaciecola sp. KUL10]
MNNKHGRLLALTSKTDTKLLENYLRLIQVTGVGPSTILKTCRLLGCGLRSLCSTHNDELIGLGWSSEQISQLTTPNKSVNKVLSWLSKSDKHSVVCYDFETYPELLKQVSQPPLVLFCLGDINLLDSPMLAIVGSRRVSTDAQINTKTLVSQLSACSELAVISGLAIGVDGIAHRQALESGMNTIAVLGCGVDVVYPKRHAKLYDSIANNGLIISEFLPGTLPQPSFFPRRNRIISGLALGTLVSEARIQSGSLVTANYAIEQNREVFAVPSNIRNPNAEGCHWLIKQGANLVERASDITDVLGDKWTKQASLSGISSQTTKKTNQSLASDLLLDSVGYESTPVDLIAQRTGISISDLLGQLLEYELRGLVASTSEGYVKLGG